MGTVPGKLRWMVTIHIIFNLTQRRILGTDISMMCPHSQHLLSVRIRPGSLGSLVPETLILITPWRTVVENQQDANSKELIEIKGDYNVNSLPPLKYSVVTPV